MNRKKTFIKILQQSRIPSRKVMSIFKMLKGHLRLVTFDSKDVSNLMTVERISRTYWKYSKNSSKRHLGSTTV